MRLIRRLISLDSVPQVQPLANHGLLFTFGDQIDGDLSKRIVRLAARVSGAGLPGVVDVVPSYTTLVLILDAATADGNELPSTVIEWWKGTVRQRDEEPLRPEVVIPVVYGGESGPDLLEVAKRADLSAPEVIERHAGASYQVGAIGFSPGFAFLIGLPPDLVTPRRTTPRTRVPAGSVGIGGAQTGIYSLETPGGWSLIGRTAVPLFDPEREPASLLQAGDRVRFESVAKQVFLKATQVAVRTSFVPGGRDALEVLTSGVQTTVQDMGRPGFGQMGVAPGGAADHLALVAGNRMLGNDDGAAALEMTLTGSSIRFLKPARIALTGADLDGVLQGMRIPAGAVRTVGAGDELVFGAAAAEAGARAYLCVAGGIDVPVRMGSRSTDLNARFGGHEGRSLRPGDRLQVGSVRDVQPRTAVAVHASRRMELRVVAGPQRDRFDDLAWFRLLGEAFTVSSSSNRMGLRLDGPKLTPQGGADIVSEGMVTGAIQVTGEGQPIVMLPARATIGGYPKIAVVVAADLDALGQLRPGDQVRFRAVDLGE